VGQLSGALGRCSPMAYGLPGRSSYVHRYRCEEIHNHIWTQISKSNRLIVLEEDSLPFKNASALAALFPRQCQNRSGLSHCLYFLLSCQVTLYVLVDLYSIDYYVYYIVNNTTFSLHKHCHRRYNTLPRVSNLC